MSSEGAPRAKEMVSAMARWSLRTDDSGQHVGTRGRDDERAVVAAVDEAGAGAVHGVTTRGQQVVDARARRAGRRAPARLAGAGAGQEGRRLAAEQDRGAGAGLVGEDPGAAGTDRTDAARHRPGRRRGVLVVARAQRAGPRALAGLDRVVLERAPRARAAGDEQRER